MGWNTGSRLMTEIILAFTEEVTCSEYEAVEFWKKVIEAFSSEDADTLSECLGEDSAYDKAYEELYGVEEDN